MAPLTRVEAEAILLPHLEGKLPSARGKALMQALIEDESLRLPGADPVCNAVTMLTWLAAEGPPALAASALSALSLQSHDGIDQYTYSACIPLLIDSLPVLAQAFRRVEVLDALAVEAPAALPLLATQMTQSRRLVPVSPGLTAADWRRLAGADIDREADEALLALLPAACHIAAAVAADQPLTSQLDFQQMKLVTNLLATGECLHNPARRSLPLAASAAAVAAARQQEAAPSLHTLAAAAVAVLERVSRLYAAASCGDVPSVRIWPMQGEGRHAGFLPTADVVEALAERQLNLLMVCQALHDTMELLAEPPPAAKQAQPAAEQGWPVTRQTQPAAKQTGSAAKQAQPAAEQTRSAAQQTKPAAKQTRSAAEHKQAAVKQSSAPVSGRQSEQSQPGVQHSQQSDQLQPGVQHSQQSCQSQPGMQHSQPPTGQAGGPKPWPRMRLPRADAAAAIQVVLRLAALAAKPRPPPEALLALSRAAIGLLPMALKVTPLVGQTAAAAAIAGHLRAGWLAPNSDAARAFWLPAAYVLLGVVGCLTEGAPAPAVIAAAEAAGTADAAADCLQAHVELSALILQDMLKFCEPGGDGMKLLKSRSPVQLLRGCDDQPDVLLLYATALVKEAADLLSGATLQLLGSAAAKGNVAVVATLQTLTTRGALQGLQAMLRLPPGVSCLFSRGDGDHCHESGVLRAAHALSAAAGAAADVLADGAAGLPDDVILAAVQSAVALLEAAAKMADGHVGIIIDADSGKPIGTRQSVGVPSSDAARFAATGCEILATALPRMRPGFKGAPAAVVAAVLAVSAALRWATGQRQLPRALQRDILTDGCRALAAAAKHGAGRCMLQGGGSADWGRQAAALRRALAAPAWQQLQGPVGGVRATLTMAIDMV